MLFSSNEFLFLFLPATLIGFWLLGRFGRKAVFSWLSAASLFFYGYWNPKYLLLLVASILLNFGVSRAIANATEDRGKSLWLRFGVIVNLGLLVYFKYLFPLLQFGREIHLVGRDFGNVLLPLGISFFTFTQIAYLIDLRHQEAEPQDLYSYVLFVTFFPHLIAGPIIHHGEMMPQFESPRATRLRADDLSVGITWFLMGLTKKVLLADRFGPVADALYSHPQAYGPAATLVGVLCYCFQLYFDFSGYSDMALGIARMYSITFPVNFNSPYKAASIIDFWQRWHMTLTRYLNLYLFNPMALNMTRRRMRRGKKATKKAQRTFSGFTEMIGYPLMVTMFLAGIWHGAGFQFLLFGVFHGVYLITNHAWRIFVPSESKLQMLLPRPICVLVTFVSVIAGQILFRANTARDAFYVMGTLLGRHAGGDLSAFAAAVPSRSSFALAPGTAALNLLLMFAIVWSLPNTQQILGQVAENDGSSLRSLGENVLRWRPNLAWSMVMLVLTTASLCMLFASKSFLYFQF